MALTAEQQRIFNQASQGIGQGSIQDMIEAAGLPATTDSYIKVAQILAENNMTAPLTRASNQAMLAAQGIASGEGKPLTPWQQQEYQRISSLGWSASDLANYYQSEGVPVARSEIDIILAAAGMGLDANPFKMGGATPTQPAMNPMAPEYEGGMAGRQAQGGMYGITFNVPKNVAGEVPRNPALRRVFNTARRENMPGWVGQTDTVLTSGRGVLAPANVQRKTLLGE